MKKNFFSPFADALEGTNKSHGVQQLSSESEEEDYYGDLQWYEKGRKAAGVGAVRRRGDGRLYKKMANGEWRLAEKEKKKRGRKAGTKVKKTSSKKKSTAKKTAKVSTKTKQPKKTTKPKKTSVPQDPISQKKPKMSALADDNKTALRLAQLIGVKEGSRRLGVSEKKFAQYAKGEAKVPAKHREKLNKIWLAAKAAEDKAERGQEGQEAFTKKRQRSPMKEDPKSDRPGLRWFKRSMTVFSDLVDMLKGKKMPVGTRSVHGGKKVVKTAEGWVAAGDVGLFEGKVDKEGVAKRVKDKKAEAKKKKDKIKRQKEKGTYEEPKKPFSGIAKTTDQIRSKYAYLGAGNIPIDYDREKKDKDGNVTVIPGVDLKAVGFKDLNPKDPSKEPCFEWKDPKAQGGKGQKKYGYTTAYKERQARDKFDRIRQVLPQLGDIAEMSGAAVANKKLSQKERDAGAVISVMAETGIRVGSIRHLEGHAGTRGALSLFPEDLVFKGNKVFLKFKGKGSKTNTAEVANPRVAAYLKERVKGAKKGERLFACNERDLDKLMESGGFEGVKNHDLRTTRATIVAADHLASSPKPPPPLPKDKEKAKALIMERVAAASVAVAEQLNNQPSVALESYVHPAIMWSYIHEVGGKSLADDFFKKAKDAAASAAKTEGGARILKRLMSLEMPGPRGAVVPKDAEEEQHDDLDASRIPAGLLEK